MNAIATIVGVFILAAMAGWTLGSLLLRVTGSLSIVVGLLCLATGQLLGLADMAIGAAMWLAGHHVYAWRHHSHKSPLARRIHTQLLPARLDPARRWTTPDTPEPGERPAPRPSRPRRRNPHA